MGSRRWRYISTIYTGLLGTTRSWEGKTVDMRQVHYPLLLIEVTADLSHCREGQKQILDYFYLEILAKCLTYSNI